jgi:hypothetical protein
MDKEITWVSGTDVPNTLSDIFPKDKELTPLETARLTIKTGVYAIMLSILMIGASFFFAVPDGFICYTEVTDSFYHDAWMVIDSIRSLPYYFVTSGIFMVTTYMGIDFLTCHYSEKKRIWYALAFKTLFISCLLRFNLAFIIWRVVSTCSQINPVMPLA